MVINPTSIISSEYAGDFLIVIKNGIKAIGGLVTIWVVFAIWKWWYARKNNILLSSMQKDLRKIKKKLKVK